MRKYRKFDEGGLTYGEDERPVPTGMSDAAELVTSGGEDVVAESGQKSKLRRNLETGELYSSDKAITRASPRSKPKAVGKPTVMAGGSRASSPAPSPAPAPSPQKVEVAGKRMPKDEESMSVSERLKTARDRARMGSTSTDERSVTERMGGSERKSGSSATDTRSISERMKSARESARSGGSGTDTRSVSERVRGALGFAKGGKIDGCARKGHTKGKMY